MGIKIALAGNPNCGKTTMFNALTGARCYSREKRGKIKRKEKER